MGARPISLDVNVFPVLFEPAQAPPVLLQHHRARESGQRIMVANFRQFPLYIGQSARREKANHLNGDDPIVVGHNIGLSLGISKDVHPES